MVPGRRALVAVLALAAAAGGARAAVTSVGATGFAIQHAVDVRAPPARAWKALVDVGAWWDPEHTYSGVARNLRIEPRAGGCFCERLAERGGVEHGRVVHVAPGKALRLSGALGPLQETGATGSLSFRLKALPEGGTRITLDYVVGGFRPGGFEPLAPLVDQVLVRQLERLRSYLDAGRPGSPTP
jgi:uncharacterized protein YndB with AHSA1/START domain